MIRGNYRAPKNPQQEPKQPLKNHMKALRFILASGVILALAGLASRALADTIPLNPSNTYGSFATNFGGSGIPNNQTSIATFNDPHQNGVPTSLVTAVTARYDNAAPAWDGAGTFTGVPGGDIADGQPGYSMYNFDFAFTGMVPYDTVDLLLSFHPTTGAILDTTINFGTFSSYADSWNPAMGFLFGSSFDPNASGVLSIALGARNTTTGLYDAMSVTHLNIGDVTPRSVPDGGTTALMLSTAFVGLIGFARKFGLKMASAPPTAAC